MTGVTTACFEPALDYVVVKIPRWDLQKFRRCLEDLVGMKSVGEVMAIGRRFEEALQKALRMLDIGVLRTDRQPENFQFNDLETELREPTHQRIFAVAEAIQTAAIPSIASIELIADRSVVSVQNAATSWRSSVTRLSNAGSAMLAPAELLLEAKRSGFADRQIARSLSRGSSGPRTRHAYGIVPCVKQIDTLAAEYPAQTNYLYLTYNGQEDDVACSEKKSVVVLGSGAYRIGSSVEFDWCCVNTVLTLRNLGYKTIIVNYNPETVSTDYNECDRLYFDELSLETVLEICRKENPVGIIVSMGGQIPNNLAMRSRRPGSTFLEHRPPVSTPPRIATSFLSCWISSESSSRSGRNWSPWRRPRHSPRR